MFYLPIGLMGRFIFLQNHELLPFVAIFLTWQQIFGQRFKCRVKRLYGNRVEIDDKNCAPKSKKLSGAVYCRIYGIYIAGPVAEGT